jgi:hypothetical protein
MMSTRITSFIDRIKSRGHDVWEAGAATPEAVRSIESAIGAALPPSYVSFLRSHGSLAIYGTVISGVTGGGRINDGRGTVLGDTETLRAEGGLPEGFLVIGPHEDGGYCLDLHQRRSDGECPVVNFEFGSVQHAKPVADTFEDWIIAFCLQSWSEQDG